MQIENDSTILIEIIYTTYELNAPKFYFPTPWRHKQSVPLSSEGLMKSLTLHSFIKMLSQSYLIIPSELDTISFVPHVTHILGFYKLIRNHRELDLDACCERIRF